VRVVGLDLSRTVAEIAYVENESARGAPPVLRLEELANKRWQIHPWFGHRRVHPPCVLFCPKNSRNDARWRLVLSTPPPYRISTTSGDSNRAAERLRQEHHIARITREYRGALVGHRGESLGGSAKRPDRLRRVEEQPAS
jgi:hypothetical protein